MTSLKEKLKMSHLRISEEKLSELRERMMNHGVDENDVAVVVVTASELDDLIKASRFLLEIRAFLQDVSR